jgi:hypothetical protein
MAEDRALPGMPKKKLVREVKSFLRRWGIVPRLWHGTWTQTWAWAWDVARSYRRYDELLPRRYRERWPRPAEIASQYVVLLMAEIKASCLFKLPFRAMDHLPECLKLPPSPQELKAISLWTAEPDGLRQASVTANSSRK